MVLFHISLLVFPHIPLEGWLLQKASLKQCMDEIGKGLSERIPKGSSYIYLFHEVEVQPSQSKNTTTSFQNQNQTIMVFIFNI